MPNETKIDEVAAELTRRIISGVYETGERLPSERDLAEELNVSRPTVRVALLRLQSENVVDIHPKSGVYVRFPRIKTAIGPLQPIHLQQKGAMGIYRALEEQERDTHIRFLEPPTIAEARGAPGIKMNLKVGTRLLRRYFLCSVQHTPYRLVDSSYLEELLPEEVLRDPAQQAGRHGPQEWLRKLREQGPLDAYERFLCRMPNAKEAELLAINRNQPVIEIERWIFVSDGRVFEYSVIVANAALHEFTYTYDDANWKDLVNKLRVGG
jgi:GntR family transcriptional regulator